MVPPIRTLRKSVVPWQVTPRFRPADRLYCKLNFSFRCRELAHHLSGLGSILGVIYVGWVVGSVCLFYGVHEKFSSRHSGFPFSSKTNIWFQLNWFALIVSFSWQCLQLVLHRTRTTRHLDKAPFVSFLLDTTRFPAVRRTPIRRGGREISTPRPY